MPKTIIYYCKIAGIRGPEAFRGETGWWEWQSISFGQNQQPGSGVGNMRPRVARVTIERDATKDDFFQSFFPFTYGDRPIPTVEIAGTKWIEGYLGPTSSVILHLKLKNASVARFYAAGTKWCSHDPGVHIPGRQDGDRWLPEVDAPPRDHCVSVTGDTVEFEVEEANVTWIYPVVSK